MSSDRAAFSRKREPKSAVFPSSATTRSSTSPGSSRSSAAALALPERHRPGKPGRGRDEHAVARDLLDPPRRGAEQEGLPRPRLVHHLLVELADPPAAVDEEHPEEAAVGDRAGVRDGEA